jgi:hypothetical protein
VCLFLGLIFRVRICHSGVPQESVISPHLFNFYVSDFLGENPLSSYADDFHLYESSPDLDTLGQKLTERLKKVSEWAAKKFLTIEPSKSHATLFTPCTREVNKHLEVYIDSTLIPLN